MVFEVLKKDGSNSGETLELSDSIFNIEPNDHVLYLAVKMYLANQRQGTHKSKERNEIRGGGKKPWKQKGRGGARAGTTRSPLWVGGGRIFGPRPRDYRQEMPKKVKALAKRSAISYKVKDNQFIVVEDFNFEIPKTREFVNFLDALKVTGKKVLFLTGSNLPEVYKSARNLPKVNVAESKLVTTYDILNSQVLIVSKSAALNLNQIYSQEKAV
ncbi:MAG: 50S ribosomal protein L4 [Ignavibacteriaceae bacterium]|nr:50S ribosomal protein L4 [Ignavibacteriaceae bacterium]